MKKIYVLVALAVLSIYTYKYTKKKDNNIPGKNICVSSEVKFYPNNLYNYPFSGEAYIYKNYSYECEIDCRIENGTIVYKWFDIGKEYPGRDNLENYPVLIHEEIRTSGVYVYEVNLKPGHYAFYIGSADNNTIAEAKFSFRGHRNK